MTNGQQPTPQMSSAAPVQKPQPKFQGKTGQKENKKVHAVAFNPYDEYGQNYLHFAQDSEEDDSDPTTLHSYQCTVQTGQVILKQLASKIRNPVNHNLESPIQVFLDDGSEGTFIKQNIADQLSITINQPINHYKIATLNGMSTEIAAQSVQFQIQTADGNWLTLSALTLPKVASPLTTTSGNKKSPDLLIGSDQLDLINIHPNSKKMESGLVQIPTKLGPVISGKIVPVQTYSISIEDQNDTSIDFQKLCSMQSLGVKEETDMDREDSEAAALFRQQIKYDPKTKRYQVPLLWKYDNPPLQMSR